VGFLGQIREINASLYNSITHWHPIWQASVTSKRKIRLRRSK